MKVSGHEVKAWHQWFFENNPHGYEFQYAAQTIRQGDEWQVRDEDVIDTADLGHLVWEGDPDADPTRGRPLSVTKSIRTWKVARSSDVVCVELPRERRDELIQVLKAWGARVLTS